jgi:hypothetical protein
MVSQKDTEPQNYLKQITVQFEFYEILHLGL